MPPVPVDLARCARLERQLLAVMAPEEAWTLPGWHCGATEGGSVGRVNSAAATAEVDGAARAGVTEVAASYAARGHRPRLRLTPLAGRGVAEQALALGWVAGTETLVMAARLPAAAPGTSLVRSSATLSWAERASASWRQVHVAGHDATEADERLRLALNARGQTAYFEARVDPDAGAVAIGLGVVGDGLLGVYDVLTVAEHRRGGHARRLLQAMLAWGAQAGAEEAYLQVAAGNAAAVSLYAGLGFEVVYSYRYFAPA